MSGIRKKVIMVVDNQPHKQSLKLLHFVPKRKYSGIYIICTMFLDVACLFIAFYILNDPIVLKPGINIELPAIEFSGGAILNGSVLSINHDGSYFYEDEKISLESLKYILSKRVISEPNLILIIEADKNSPHKALVEAWSIAQRAGIEQISIATGLKSK